MENNAPPELLQYLKNECGLTHPQVAVESDISLEGEYSSRWLISDGDSLLVVQSENGRCVVADRIGVASVEKITVSRFWGCGSLGVTSEDCYRELVRFSLSKLPQFREAKARLDSLIGTGEKVELDAETSPEVSEEEEKTPIPVSKFKLGPRIKTLVRLASYLKPYWKFGVLLTLLVLVGSLLQLVPPYFIKVLVDDVFGADSPRAGLLVTIVAVLIASQAVVTLVGIGRSRISGWLGGRISADLRSELFTWIQFLSISYFDRKTTGSVTASITQDTRTLHLFAVDLAESLTVNVILCIGIGAMLFYLNPILAVLVVLPLPVALFLSKVFFGKMTTRLRAVLQAWMYLYRTIDRSISGIRLVKAYGQEEREVDRFRAKNTGLFDREWDTHRAMSLYLPTLTFITASGSFVVWLIGGLMVIGGRVTLGSLLAFIAYTAMLYAPLQAFARMGEMISRALASAERVFETLDTVPEISEAKDAVPMKNVRGEVVFSNVTFGYDKNRHVLRDICLEAQQGEMIGLVGHSGAGKSTTVNLLCRFYDVDEGSVRIDGVDVKQLRIKDLRKSLGIVPQDALLFEGSVAENIAFSDPNTSPEKILTAATLSNAHDFVMQLEDAYDSGVGQGGQRLSRGQRQMISIARVVLADPSILVLDEPTSSVDLETEEKIQEALFKVAEKRTTFAIAHRLSTLKNCNRLVVLKDGEIAESGTHDELLEIEGGIYKNMVEIYSKISRLRAVE
jgi:ATP-binding cassette subfamily B protein